MNLLFILKIKIIGQWVVLNNWKTFKFLSATDRDREKIEELAKPKTEKYHYRKRKNYINGNIMIFDIYYFYSPKTDLSLYYVLIS